MEEFAVIANAMRFLTEILVHSKEKEHVARLVQELRLKLEKHIPVRTLTPVWLAACTR